VLEALNAKDQARVNIIQLLTEGPELISDMQQKEQQSKKEDSLVVRQHS
jgi:hypothetical protein